MPTAPAPERFVVLGVHRSGTSLLARILVETGCYAGRPHRFRPPDDLNPLGFHEHLVVHGLNRRILGDVGAGLANPVPALAGIPAETVTRFRGPIRRVLGELEPHRPWMVKDPQLCLTLPAWLEAIDDPMCLLTLRHPLEVARSLERVGAGMRIEFGLAQWEAYTVGAINASAGCDRALVDHARLLADPEPELGRLGDLTGIDIDPATVRSIVRPELRRVGSGPGDELPREVARLYEQLKSAGLPEPDELLSVSDRSLEIIEQYAGGGATSRSPAPCRVAVVVDGRLDPVGNRATALVRRSWGCTDLSEVDVFYSFSDPPDPDAMADLGAYLPGGPPELTEGAVFGQDDAIVCGSGDTSDPKARLLQVLLALTHLVDVGDHEAYLFVDPFTHVDVERLTERVRPLIGTSRLESASLDPDDGSDERPFAFLLTRRLAEVVTAAAADVIASSGGDDPVQAIRSWIASEVEGVEIADLAGRLIDLRARRFHDQEQRSGAVCHRFVPERVHEMEWFHDRHNGHLVPGFAEPTTPNVAANDLIFVQIPSYRDDELPKTVRSLLDNADRPERLRVGICWQYDEWTATDLDPWIDDPRFRIDEVYYRHARGCSWARSRVNQLYDGEGYTLQIDSHMRFAPGWDTKLVAMLEGIDAPKPLLTAYPPGYGYDGDGDETLNLGTGIQRVRVNHLGPNLTAAQVGEMAPDPSRPGPTFHLAGGYVFAHGQFVLDVPSDEQTYFNGEELALAARAFTHGYDMHYPSENLIWHLYYQPAPKHWGDSRTWGNLQRQAVHRLRTLFTGDHESLGSYGFGTVRSIADYERYAGLDLRAARFDLPAPRLHEVRVDVDLATIGLETRVDYERFRIRLHDEQYRIIERCDVIDPAILNGEVTTHRLEAVVPEPAAFWSVRAKHAEGWTESAIRAIPGHRAKKKR